MAKLPKLTKIKIQDGRRPPSWISVERPCRLNDLSSTLQIRHRARDQWREHGEITKIDKNLSPRWPPAAILDFGLLAITFERFELDTSNLSQG